VGPDLFVVGIAERMRVVEDGGAVGSAALRVAWVPV